MMEWVKKRIVFSVKNEFSFDQISYLIVHFQCIGQLLLKRRKMIL